mgnify:CR=1 FL=1
MERHDHGWWYSRIENVFKCDYADEEGNPCPEYIKMEAVTKHIPKDSIHLSSWTDDQLHRRQLGWRESRAGG